MAKIKSKTISWNPSVSDDVVEYKVYYKLDDGAPIEYSTDFISTTVPEVTAPGDFPEGTFDTEGDYRIGVGVVDDVGNESDIVEVVHPFDVNPPEPVTGLSVS
jgi:hypothetical protein